MEQQPQQSHIIDVQSQRSKERVTRLEGKEDEKAAGGKEEKKRVEEEVENKEKMKEEKEENISSHTVTITAPVTVSLKTFKLFSAPSIMY